MPFLSHMRSKKRDIGAAFAGDGGSGGGAAAASSAKTEPEVNFLTILV